MPVPLFHPSSAGSGAGHLRPGEGRPFPHVIVVPPQHPTWQGRFPGPPATPRQPVVVDRTVRIHSAAPAGGSEAGA
ncbi:hypothetical protein AB0952_38240 [Streptomyces caniferus]|uniref:hypothetical protein n=1 Tax=Streptomyces caniferus TaxID=285557 RepID=UPI00345231E3